MKILRLSALLIVPLFLTPLPSLAETSGGHPYPTNDTDAAHLSWEGNFKVGEEKKITIEVFDEAYIHENFVEGSRHPTVTFLVFHDGPSGWGKSIQDLPKDKFTGPGGHVEKTNLPLSKEDNKWVGEIVIVPQKSLKSIAIWKLQNKGGVHVGYDIDLKAVEVEKENEVSLAGSIKRTEAKPDKGFHFPYFFFVPESIQGNSNEAEKNYVLVQPNNTGQPSDDYSRHVSSAKQLTRRRTSWAKELFSPVLVPVFPRIDTLYIHSLDHRTLKADRKEFQRVDLQLLAMVDDLRNRLSQAGITTKEQILINGFSADGMFANRFTIIHPDQVKAAAIGSPGGWPTLPLDSWQGLPLVYPLGVYDLEKYTGEKFNLDGFCKTPTFLYIGAEDKNQHKDDYYYSTAKFVLGEKAPEIWKNAEKAYDQAGCRSTFKIYPGVGHNVTYSMKEDVLAFLEEQIS